MVRPEGFELPTYRFVACCSIQLSYERLVKMDISRASEKRQAFFCLFRRKRLAFCGKPSDCHGVVRPERFELPTHRFVACCSIQLSHERPTTANIGKRPVVVKRFFLMRAFFSSEEPGAPRLAARRFSRKPCAVIPHCALTMERTCHNLLSL